MTWGVDGLYRIDTRRVLSANIARSSSSDGGDDSAAGSVTLEDANRDGFGYRFTLSLAGAGFDPGVGFVPRRDYREADGQWTWGIVRGAGSRVLRWGPLAEGTYLVRHTTGELETAQLSTGGEAEFKSGAMVRGGIVRTLDRLDEPFVIHDNVMVPAGRHTFTWGRLFAMTAQAPALAASVFAQVGGYYDGRIASATFSPRLRLAPFVELRSDLEAFRITLPLRNQVFDGSVIRLRGRLSLNPAWSADVLLQHASAPSRSGGNLRIHYYVREGTSLWIALNRALTRDVPGADGPLRVEDRTLVVKYIHTFGPS